METQQEVLIPIEKLRYDFDSHIGCGKYHKHIENFLEAMEKSLPEVPKRWRHFQETKFSKLINVYESVKKQGLINPLVVTEKDGLYRVRVGNQRLCSLRALGSKDPVPCIIHTTNRKIETRNLGYKTVEGCESV